MNERRLHEPTGLEYLIEVKPGDATGYWGYWRCLSCDFDGWTTSTVTCKDQASEEAAAFFHGHAMIYHGRCFKQNRKSLCLLPESKLSSSNPGPKPA